MAHITQETKKEIVKEIKKILKEKDLNIKMTASVRDYRCLYIKLKNDQFKNEDEEYETLRRQNEIDYSISSEQVTGFPRSTNLKTLALYKEINEIIRKVGKYYNNSDCMTDYFDVAFYYYCELV
jgi:hypothetical protein